ncbi:hypothetical protein ACFOEM_14270 [Paenalcaligenes hominis]|uniref:hypothetical protein n=1 Tax=Paenalcaligenes hominis TaxID=643674 RepID=UPI003617E967
MVPLNQTVNWRHHDDVVLCNMNECMEHALQPVYYNLLKFMPKQSQPHDVNFQICWYLLCRPKQMGHPKVPGGTQHANFNPFFTP